MTASMRRKMAAEAFVILSVLAKATEQGLLAGVAIGAVISLAAMFAGPLKAASTNPDRCLDAAVLSMRLDHLWPYRVAAIMGASVAVCRCVQAPGCCGGAVEGACS